MPAVQFRWRFGRLVLQWVMMAFLAIPQITHAQEDPVQQACTAFQVQDFDRAWQLLGTLSQNPSVNDSIRLFYAISIIESGRESYLTAKNILRPLELSATHRPLFMYGMARIAFFDMEDRSSDSLFRLALSLDFEAYYPDIPIRYHYQILKSARQLYSPTPCVLQSDARSIVKQQAINVALATLTDVGRYISVPEVLRSEKDRSVDYQVPAFYHTEQSFIVFSSFAGGSDPDFFISRRINQGDWEIPVKLDSMLNSQYWEYAAWFSDNADTVYFSSSRESSMGGLDVFRSTLDPVSLQWSAPVNMQMPLNSRKHDYLLFPVKQGREWAILSNRNTSYGLVSVASYRVDCDTHTEASTVTQPMEFIIQDTIPAPADTLVVPAEFASAEVIPDTFLSEFIIDTIIMVPKMDTLLNDSIEPEVFLSVWIMAEGPDSKLTLARLTASKPDIVIVTRKDEVGKNYFTSGVFIDYNEARKHLSIDIQDLAPNAKVIALQNGIQIPVIDAIRLLRP